MCFIVEKPVDDPSTSDVNYVPSRKGLERRVWGLLLIHAGGNHRYERYKDSESSGSHLNMLPYPGKQHSCSPHVWYSHPICTNSWICLWISDDDEHGLPCCWGLPSLIPRPCFIKVTGGKTGPGRHCQGPSAHALVCPRIPGVTVISVWKPFRILV